ncbi:MAG: STAS domain-containing protein [Lentisphaerae bacterium]|jgi:anti-anti-sigma factor|nr:STAS domain-containing protein [Lentisphaerota bacterium]
MNIELAQQGGWAVLRLEGRLDATWSEHVVARAREVLRSGRHHLLLDAAGISFLSSAGIRVLIQLSRDVTDVQGRFLVARPSEFVAKTLQLAGLESLLATEELLASVEAAEAASEGAGDGMALEVHRLDEAGGMTLNIAAGWRPWDAVDAGGIRHISLPRGTVALGIGAPDEDAAQAASRMGEFMAVAGCLVHQPADGQLHPPDYIAQRGGLVPELHAVQALVAEGRFSHLLRFHPAEESVRMDLAGLASAGLKAAGADAAVLVVLAECDGLVGARLAQSPIAISGAEPPGDFPNVRDWIHFCGERLHAGQSALVVALVARSDNAGRLPAYMAAMPSAPGLLIHAHAAAFTFRPLPAGIIQAEEQIPALFEARDPLDLLHLLEDDRPLTGLGRSQFVRGAAWCAPLRTQGEGGA